MHQIVYYVSFVHYSIVQLEMYIRIVVVVVYINTAVQCAVWDVATEGSQLS